jgi:hypothetical protein
MSRDSIDGIRLQKLLGGIELANLRQRFRARYERGASRDEFTLMDLLGHERRALAGLLGRRAVALVARKPTAQGPKDFEPSQGP